MRLPRSLPGTARHTVPMSPIKLGMVSFGRASVHRIACGAGGARSDRRNMTAPFAKGVLQTPRFIIPTFLAPTGSKDPFPAKAPRDEGYFVRGASVIIRRISPKPSHGDGFTAKFYIASLPIREKVAECPIEWSVAERKYPAR